jgi:hypothetical protein
LEDGTVFIPAYHVVENTINSKEFQDYIADVLVDEIIYEIEDL